MLDMIEAAKAQARSLPNACEADIDLVVKLLKKTPEDAVVVQLGAGSGTLTMAILGARPKANYTVVDISEANLNWELKALENCGWTGKRTTILGQSAATGRTYAGPKIDFILIDTDHSYEGVMDDLRAWSLNVRGVIMVHDYDGRTAPYQYPTVALACKDFFRCPPDEVQGWSAAWVWPRKRARSK